MLDIDIRLDGRLPSAILTRRPARRQRVPSFLQGIDGS